MKGKSIKFPSNSFCDKQLTVITFRLFLRQFDETEVCTIREFLRNNQDCVVFVYQTIPVCWPSRSNCPAWKSSPTTRVGQMDGWIRTSIPASQKPSRSAAVPIPSAETRILLPSSADGGENSRNKLNDVVEIVYNN